MKRDGMRYNVDVSKIQINSQVRNMIIAAKSSQKHYADDIRDIMKEEFYKGSHRGAYGASTPLKQGSSASLAEQGIVTATTGEGTFRVGAKKGSAYGSTYEHILYLQSIEFTYIKPHVFELPKHRQSASDNGVWVVKTMPKNPYMEETQKRVQSSDGRKIYKENFEKEIKKALGV